MLETTLFVVELIIFDFFLIWIFLCVPFPCAMKKYFKPAAGTPKKCSRVLSHFFLD